MIATANSIASPTGGGMTMLKPMMRMPTTATVIVWPSPHSAPMTVVWKKRLLRARIVVTAMTWSASVACRMPSRNPRPARAKSWVMRRGTSMRGDSGRAAILPRIGHCCNSLQ